MLRIAFDHDSQNYFLLFQQGEEQGFNYFFHLHYKHLVHFACAIIKDKEVAEDVVEDSFVKLWEKRETLSSASSIKPYLFTCVRNGCINLLRHQKHQEAFKVYVQKSPVEVSADVTQKIIASESMHQVYLAVQNLPSKYRKIFNMLWVQGKEVKDIALELNLPLSTVKSQKARTLELIRKQLPHLGTGLLLLSMHIF
jgi:RNA polymerase sigma-70 factor (family 1)